MKAEEFELLLGQDMRDARETLHLTREELGKILNTTGVTIYRWENLEVLYGRIKPVEKYRHIQQTLIDLLKQHEIIQAKIDKKLKR